MESVTASLATRARSIFDDLGYTVVGEGSEFRAERDWKVVRVTATDGEANPDDEGLHCYVTPSEQVGTLRRRLAGGDSEEWAIIAIDGEDYEVVRAPPGPATPT
ncbi:hypothetical protein L593_11835 [Salinarchaeum sp. Harcht-Bsk1]|uniref:DUF7116 family protein n=1 Tax=Salinarchaeum sp. Harcht-Bsk1 TaxID=1333523 RepID=UPI0003422814|nr:hypothetical protein [Salinarchaeum sp. Harcht-Bsk1]AGN02310.1 hypothetical protein L593_11835 [Salinarchaeum sp. Harcht-Bsk1]